MFETIHSIQGETTKKHHQGMEELRKGRKGVKNEDIVDMIHH
jgi:hypothetical protein